MRIQELADLTGASERSLRYYEQRGLLRPARQPNGYRDYAEADVDEVHRIRMLLAAGLSTEVIAQVLPCMVDEGGVLAPCSADMVPTFLAERQRIDEAIAELAATRDLLDAIVAATPDLPPDEACPDEAASGSSV
ncbi:MerR family transcriptional regulator [Iamia sp. SCSIO 61187]|uniref:MerR family transcriptional regulator n=1 Tax=Iamia sp. SCSIO 61187 TaxID=2722752 RepID=UPI001C625A5C|nr:MerR family transcriptional regulator [Iamia sp. SCSIO 61187]QYG91929.1 MerR family transcriptional regulator [Iamia sp. SCSIO 61187]